MQRSLFVGVVAFGMFGACSSLASSDGGDASADAADMALSNDAFDVPALTDAGDAGDVTDSNDASDAPVPADSGDAADARDGACATSLPQTTIDTGTSAEITIVGDIGSTEGVFDPSLVYPAGAPAGAMSYSSVPDQHDIRTRIALSVDNGATWHYAIDANAPAMMTVPSTNTTLCPGGQCTGQVINEVSSLIIDPDDPNANARWKLFTHRYLVLPGDQLHYEIGHIAMYTASAPDGTWSAAAPLIGWNSSSTFSSTGVALNVSNVAALRDCVVVTEPGAVWRPGVIDLALGCVSLASGTPQIRIVLLRSTDHATTFSYVSTLLDASESLCLGADEGVNGADLFLAGGHEYLIATPNSSHGYLGCDVYAVDDVDLGVLRTDTNGAPLVLRSIATNPTQFSGACSFAEGATAVGYAMDVGFLMSPPRVFRLFGAPATAP